MATLETYRKRAKQLQRWHREGNYSVGGRLRRLPRFRGLSDRAVLDQAMPLALAQEVIAVEAGFADWSALKAAHAETPKVARSDGGPVHCASATPILFVRDVALSAAFYRDRLGFAIGFLHGKPPFYGAVQRDAACLHLRHVEAPNFAELAAREPSLILATIRVTNVKALFAEAEAAGAPIAQKLVRHPWGGTDFQVRDPDGNIIAFVQADASPAISA